MIARNASLELWLQHRTSEHRDAAIEAHRYLCTRAARKFVRDGIDRHDLEQVGSIGLIKAVDRYEEAQGAPFEAYAWRLILGELMHYVRDSERLLRAPRRLRELDRRWRAGERDLTVVLGREPSEGEIAKFVGITLDERNDIASFRRAGSVLSVDALHESQRFAYTIESEVDRIAIREAIEKLSPIEREILVDIYERDTPLLAIAERMGYSRRHVTRLHRAALKKLFSNLTSKST